MVQTEQAQFFSSVLFNATGKELKIKETSYLSGGCINNAVRLDTSEGKFFIKWNENKPLDMFGVEADGLKLLRDNCDLKVPDVLGVGKIDDFPFLLLEYIDASPSKAGDYWENFGHSIAKLHQKSCNEFGLDYNNYIGALQQNNYWMESWEEFFIENRLRVQFGLAYYNGLIGGEYLEKLDKFQKNISGLFPKEKPSLIHGDLWSGNIMVDANGEACMIDPAVYFGHRESELAFTTLFGGFDEQFYKSYEEVFPLTPDFEERIPIYNMYPLMVHVNLFGKSYLKSVDEVLKRFA